MINCKYCRNTDCWFKGEKHEVNECKHYLPTTNADRIRSMTNEELANELCHIAVNVFITCNGKAPKQKDYQFGSYKCILNWLTEEVT